MHQLDKVATGSYYVSVRAVEKVGIKNLKNNLSAYIRRVRKGTRILVTDRDEVVAELSEPRPDERTEDIHPLLAEWMRRGELHRGKSRKTPLPRSPVRLKPGTAQRLLDLDRGD